MTVCLSSHQQLVRTKERSRCFCSPRELQRSRPSLLPVFHTPGIASQGVPKHAYKHLRALAIACSPWRHVAHAAVAVALLFGDPASANTGIHQLGTPGIPPPAVAGLFSSQASIDADPVDPFTFKKFLIENLDGERVVSRKRGITTTVCTAALGQADETPEMQFLPIAEKVRLANNQKCRKAETQEPEEGCALTCPTSCQAALDSYLVTYGIESGYQLEEPAKQKLLASCTRRCNRECVKGGNVYNFVVNFRRY